ncbi:MAG: AAA family ATPase, partial [Actinobacteria bacterium]|nr:AAA family ATPase [Actinomycetota bacterium]
ADVRGQNAAIATLAKRVALHAMQTAPRRPLTLFAVGPTGVGKTQAGQTLVAALAEAGAELGYLRLDMSEYQESHSVSKLLGAPAGYVGYNDGAPLVDALRDGTPTVVHFDEIEKAHPNVLRALMNAMDAGRISASGQSDGPNGREIGSRRSVFYFTSNLDAEGIERALEEHRHSDLPHVVDEVCRERLRRSNIAPELVGRIHGFLAFRPLGRSARAEVAALAVARVAAQYGVRIGRIEPSVLVHLLSEADEGFGARPLEYLVESQLGPAFVAARRYGSAPVVVSGPPYRCALSGDDAGPDAGPDIAGIDLGNLPLN